MPAPTVVSDFLECVRKSGVADPERLDQYLARVGADAPDTPARMAEALIAEGLLTRFQADHMLRGRWRNFVLCGKYTILEPIGAGGMGTVYLCLHKIMRRPVAIKVLPVAQADDPGSVERFHREAQAVAQLRHPNIVGAHDVDKDGKFHFLVMEFVDGVSLQDLVKRRGPLDPIRAAHYIHQAALGLEHAHEAGLVHRDVKPANLLVDRQGVVKILDLGLARFFRDTRESVTQKYDANAVLGTADYVAPEQAVDSHNVDIRCDIYSLGITFYFLLAGRSPFQDGSVAEKLIWHQVRQPKPIRELRPDTPQGLAAVLDKMIAKDRGQRYQTPVELAEALAPWTQTPIDPPAADDIPEPTQGARIAGLSDSNQATPRTPSPNTPTPAGGKPASSGRRRPPDGPPLDDTITRKDVRTAAMPVGPPTMKKVKAAAAAGEAKGPPGTDTDRLKRRVPWLIAVAVALGVLVLAGVGIGVGLSFWHPTPPPVVNGPPAPPGLPVNPPPDFTPVAGVTVTHDADGYHVKTAKYETLLGPEGCLNSLNINGVEYFKPGEPLFKGETTARGGYFYCEKPPYKGLVLLSKIEQIEPKEGIVFKAVGDKFSVTYDFTPEAIRLKATNATDETVPFYFVLDSAPVKNVLNGRGERLNIPVRGDPDSKWETTTWVAGPSAVKIVRTDPGDVKLWGPFGKAQSQVWEGDVGTYQTAEIRLEPTAAPDLSRQFAPPDGVAITKLGAARRVQTDLYDAVVDADGCMPSLRVDGVELFKPSVGISRGLYIIQGNSQTLPNVDQTGPAEFTAIGAGAALVYSFAPDKITWSVEDRSDKPEPFFVVFDPAVIAVRNAKDEWSKTPLSPQANELDPKWQTTSWYAGRARITINGGTKVWGPWENRYQVWEATLAPREKRTVTVEVALTTPDEAQKAAATAGTKPPAAEVALYAPLDYQVVQRKTRLQGTIPVRGKAHVEFDKLEARLTGAALGGAPTGQWQALATTAGKRTFDAALPAPAGGWYRLEVRALKGDKEVASSSVEHVGVGEVFLGAGQSNSTNCGQERIYPKSGMVSTFSGTDWRPADDPQPGVHDGTQGGSYWPAFGDAMYEKYKVPIGVASTGHSGTSVNAWEPGGELFQWTTTRMIELGNDGFRAMLWHQGESDVNMPPDEYDKKMTELIQASRKTAGWDVPWFVAQVSYHNPKETSFPAIRQAQKKLWDSGAALEGPDTDTLTGANRDQNGQGIHFSPGGLAAHAKLWANKVGVWLDKILAK
jgi:serine/threonine protein kinase